MTPEEIDELERLMTAATPGPWRDEREPPPTRNRWFETHDGAPIESRGTHFALGVAVGVTAEPRDAAAIVALHNAAPALIEAAREVERLRAFVPRWRKVDDGHGLYVGTARIGLIDSMGYGWARVGPHPEICHQADPVNPYTTETAARAVCARLGIPYVPVEVSDG